MATTRLGVGGPSAAYPGFSAKEASVSTLHEHEDIDATVVVSEDVTATVVTSEDVTGTV